MTFFSFFKGKSIICPYCLTENRYNNGLDSCLKCKTELPAQYVSNYDSALPFFIQLIGWTRSGKTTYLQSLTLMLKKMDRYWKKKYVCSPLTAATLEFMRNVNTFEIDGAMPVPTQVKLHDAYILLLQGMERWGNRTLVTRDVAGEAFYSLQFPLEYMPYLTHTPVSLMMISIDDLINGKKLSVDDLINSYVDTLARNRKSYKTDKLRIIVVLSKADKFLTDLPETLRLYVEEDPFSIQVSNNRLINDTFMNEYMNNLYSNSALIADWFSQKLAGGQLFINKARRENIQLYFTLVSSLGGEPGPDAKMLTSINPLRVLDPYFLALDFYSKDSHFQHINSHEEINDNYDDLLRTALSEQGGPPTNRKLKVFLCHASQDKPIVQELYQKLINEGWIEPWLDIKNLLPGQNWQAEIRNAVEKADAVVIFLSYTSTNKDGFIQKELRLAKDLALEKNDGSIFLVPLRLDSCEVPKNLQLVQWADYFGEEQEQTYYKLIAALKIRLKDIDNKFINK